MINSIEEQTENLAAQLNKLENTKTDDEYLIELEVYNQMLKEADFSVEAQAASKKKELKWYDKAAPLVNMATKQVNKVNKKLKAYNKKRVIK